MEEQLRASVYQYLVEAGEKKAAKAFRKAHADEELDAKSPSLQDLFKAHTAASAKKAPAPAAANEDDGEKPKKDRKKRKKDAAEEAPKEEEPKEEAAEEPKASEPASLAKSEDNGSIRKGKKQVERFQRIVASEVEFLDPRLVDYSHESKGDDDWGNKANQILSAVRGKDFRHEKTKKKRGTYKGGRITAQVNSIKFDD